MKRTLVSLLVAVSITMTACGGAGSSSQGQQADAAQETAEAGQAEQAAQDAAAPEQTEQAAQDAAEAGQEAAEPAKEDAAGEITYVEQELCGCKFSRPDKWIQFPSDDTSEQFIFDAFECFVHFGAILLFACAKMLISAGIKKIICGGEFEDELTKDFMKEVGIPIIKYN